MTTTTCAVQRGCSCQVHIMTGFSKDVSSSAGNEARKRYVPGDVVWIPINSSSLWPAQVVGNISHSVAPEKKMKDDILVRLYGSYDHLYVNPCKCRKLENMLKQENISTKEAFKLSLEEDISINIRRVKSKRKFSEFKGDSTAGVPIGKRKKKPSPIKTNKTSAKTEVEDGVKHEAADNAIQDEARKTRLTDEARVETFEGNSIKRAESQTDTKKRKGAFDVETTNKGSLRRSLRNKVEEQVSETIETSSSSKQQTPEKLSSKEQDAIQKADNGNSEIKDARQTTFLQVTPDSGVTGEASYQESAKHSDTKSTCIGDSEPETTAQSYNLRRNIHMKRHEEATRFVILELATIGKLPKAYSGLADAMVSSTDGASSAKRTRRDGQPKRHTITQQKANVQGTK